MKRLAVLALALTLSAGLARADEGTFATLDLDWRDDARGRDVPVRLYWPEAASVAKPVPLIVFSHGIGGSRMGYSYLGKHWAAQGFAALHVQHVGSDRSVWGGNPFAMVSRLQGAARESEALNRVADLRFALDALLASPKGAQVDAERIAVAGHSYGANTALLAIGARVERDGRAVELREPRFKAALVISAPPFYGEADPARILAPIDVPTLHVTATDDIIRIPGYYSGADDRVAVWHATGGPSGTPKWLAVFQGGSHSMFTDRLGAGGSALNPQVKAATKELSAAFFARLFERGGAAADAALQAWPTRFSSIVSRWVAPPQ